MKFERNMLNVLLVTQTEFKLDPKESLDTLIKKTKKVSSYSFLKAIDLLNTLSYIPKENDETKATYNTFPRKEDVLRSKGK